MGEACPCNFCSNSRMPSKLNQMMKCSVTVIFDSQNVIDFKGGQNEALEKEAIEHMRQRCEELEKSMPEQILKF